MKKIGTVEIQKCFDGKEHECTLTDYLVRLTGNTYEHKGTIYNEDFQYDGDDKAWYKNCDSEEEINRLYKKFKGTGIQFSLKPIFRITDEKTNKIEY